MTSGEPQTFTAAVTGSLNQTVTWSVQEGSAGGTINSSGIYLAPVAFGTYHVVATSQADSTKSGRATITVAAVSVAITPASVGIRPSAAQIFAATVMGSRNTAVTWTIQEGAAGGTITIEGVFTAPVTLGTFHVVATSVAHAGKSATATVSVQTSGFFSTGSMGTGRVDHTATLLPNGKVLVAGGNSIQDPDPDETTGGFLATAELYDPLMGSFAPTGSMGTSRAHYTATLLLGEKVLVAGGGPRVWPLWP
jgi:hypothetical protein